MFFRYQPRDTHFEVQPDAGIPVGHIELPRRMMAGMEFDQVPDIVDYLVAKPRHSVRLSRLQEYEHTDLE